MITFKQLKRILSYTEIYIRESIRDLTDYSHDINLDDFIVDEMYVAEINEKPILILDLDFSIDLKNDPYSKCNITMDDLGVTPDSHYNPNTEVIKIHNLPQEIKKETMLADCPWYVLVDTDSYQFMRLIKPFKGDINKYTFYYL